MGARKGVRSNAHPALFAAPGLAVFLGYLDPHSKRLALQNTPKWSLAAA